MWALGIKIRGPRAARNHQKQFSSARDQQELPIILIALWLKHRECSKLRISKTLHNMGAFCCYRRAVRDDRPDTISGTFDNAYPRAERAVDDWWPGPGDPGAGSGPHSAPRGLVENPDVQSANGCPCSTSSSRNSRPKRQRVRYEDLSHQSPKTQDQTCMLLDLLGSPVSPRNEVPAHRARQGFSLF